jgi:hypothetical protein
MKRLLFLLGLKKVDLLDVPLERRLLINYLIRFNRRNILWNGRIIEN